MKCAHVSTPAVALQLAILGLFFGFALPCPGQRGARDIETRSYFFEDADREIDYTLYVPTGYDESKETPLVVLLHGLGSNPQQVIRYRGITAEAEKRGYIVVAPYGYNERGWYGSRGKGKEGAFFGQAHDPENLGELSEKDVMNVLGIVRKEFNIDEDRVYLMGHSMGGGGTVHLGATYPDIWAGLAPMAPAFHGSRAILEQMKHIPVFVVTGEEDRLVPVADVRSWVGRMKELEMDYRYNEIAGGNHFDTITRNPEMIADLFEFFDAQRRGGDKIAAAESYRTFTNNAGKTIKAKPVSVSAGRVNIIRDDGKSFDLSLSSLSEADQEYLNEWLASDAPR